MELEYKIRKNEINIQFKKVLLVLLFSVAWSFSMGYFGVDNSMLMMKIMLSVLGMPEWQRDTLVILGSLMMIYAPTVLTIICNIKIHKLNKEHEKLKIEEKSYLCNKIFEENKNKIDELLEQGKILSRKELMDILNTTKLELIKAEKKKKAKFKTVDELMLNYLQDGLEDILFPSVFDEKEKNYTRKKEK